MVPTSNKEKQPSSVLRRKTAAASRAKPAARAQSTSELPGFLYCRSHVTAAHVRLRAVYSLCTCSVRLVLVTALLDRDTGGPRYWCVVVVDCSTVNLSHTQQSTSLQVPASCFGSTVEAVGGSGTSSDSLQ